jgi:hypothetical protein
VAAGKIGVEGALGTAGGSLEDGGSFEDGDVTTESAPLSCDASDSDGASISEEHACANISKNTRAKTIPAK